MSLQAAFFRAAAAELLLLRSAEGERFRRCAGSIRATVLLGGPGRAWGGTKRPSKAVAPIATGLAATILAAIATSHSAATETTWQSKKKC